MEQWITKGNKVLYYTKNQGLVNAEILHVEPPQPNEKISATIRYWDDYKKKYTEVNTIEDKLEQKPQKKQNIPSSKQSIPLVKPSTQPHQKTIKIPLVPPSKSSRPLVPPSQSSRPSSSTQPSRPLVPPSQSSRPSSSTQPSQSSRPLVPTIRIPSFAKNSKNTTVKSSLIPRPKSAPPRTSIKGILKSSQPPSSSLCPISPVVKKSLSFSLKSPNAIDPREMTRRNTRSQKDNIRGTLLVENIKYEISNYEPTKNLDEEQKQEEAIEWAKWCQDINTTPPKHLSDWCNKLPTKKSVFDITNNEIKTFEGTLYFTNQDMIEYAYQLKNKKETSKVAILNMANGRNAGGGYFNVSGGAQEEQLCERSSLLPRLKMAQYEKKYGGKGLRIGDTLLTENVSIMRNKDNIMVEPVVLCDVISAAATPFLSVNQALKYNALDTDIKKTWKSILLTAKKAGTNDLVISVIGANVRNPVKNVVECLFETLKKGYPIDAESKLNIHFAVNKDSSAQEIKEIIEKEKNNNTIHIVQC